MLRIKGVRKHECGKFQARIWDGERNIHLGVFNSAEEASAAYEQMAIEMFGDFARAK